jgi:putative aldouronate transport system substrate-binding protein
MRKLKRALAVLALSMVAFGAFAAGPSKILPTPAGQLPVVPAGKKVELTVAVMQTPWIADYSTNYFTRWVEEKTGVKLKFVLLPQDTITEKVMLTLSTNDVKSLPDIYLSVGMSANNTIFGPSYASYWYDQGMIIPLNDLIDKYGFFFNKALDTAAKQGYDIESWMTSPDGNIYALPAFSASPTNAFPHKLWINAGWLKKLGLQAPTTTEEFRNVLRAFKNNDPNGNGKKDEIPFSGAKSDYYYGYDPIINAFIYNQSHYSRMYVQNGTVKFAPTTPQWREAMKYLRSLKDEGLYYPGSFTQDTTSIQQMAIDKNDILGAFEGLGHDLVLTTKDQSVIDRYDSMPALKGPEGNHFVTWDAPGIRPAGVITANCQYPEIAFRVLDLMSSDEGGIISRYGEKGVNWDSADSGSISVFGNPAVIKVIKNTWAAVGQNQNFLQQGPFILDPMVTTGVQWDRNPKSNDYIKAQAVIKLRNTGVVPKEFIANLIYTNAEAEAIRTPKTNIDSYILQSIANFVAGDWDPNNDAQWSSFVAEFEKMGLSTYLKTVQTAYTRMQKKVKK